MPDYRHREHASTRVAVSRRSSLLRVRGKRWRRWRQARRMLLHLCEDVVNRSLQLYIAAGHPITRRIVYGDVRINAVVLDRPLRINTVGGVLGNGDVTAIEQEPLAANAADTAPTAGAHQRPEPVLAEIIRKNIPVR